jgi:drug/metabolite transporter (DMT)-like permease
MPGRLQFKGVWLGWALALISTFTFSIATPLGKAGIMLGLDPTTMLVLRFGLAILLLAGSMALTTPDRLRIDRKGLLIATTAGVVNGIGALTFFWALTRIDASVATMIYSLNPLVVLGLLALRGETLTYRHLIRLALGLSGIYLLIGPGAAAVGGVDWLGVLLVLYSVFGVAVELTLVQWFMQSYGTRTVTLYVLTAMWGAIFVFWLARGAEWHDPGWQGWLIIGVLALVCTYLGWLAMFTGIRTIGSGQVALLIPLETCLSVVWAFLFLQERLTFWQTVGGGLILLSATLAVQRLSRVRWRPRWRARLRV